MPKRSQPARTAPKGPPCHPFLSHAELARLAARRDQIENHAFGHRLYPDEVKALDALLYGAAQLTPVAADALRMACGLPALDAERAAVAAVLENVGFWTASTVEIWAPFAALGLPVVLGCPANRYADAAWHISRLDEALLLLDHHGLNYTVAERATENPMPADLAAMWRGPSLTIIFHACQSLQVAA